MLDLIDEKAKTLASMPGIGRPRPEFGAGLRSFAVASFVIFYRPLADGIEIARVVHGARDLDRIF